MDSFVRDILYDLPNSLQELDLKLKYNNKIIN